MYIPTILLIVVTPLAFSAPTSTNPLAALTLPSNASLGLALPIPDASNASVDTTNGISTLTPRADLKRMRYCEHANGRGACYNQDFVGGTCYGFSAWWNDRISSVYVNVGTYCVLYANGGCGGKSAQVYAPGVLDLKTAGLNDAASSVKCSPAYGAKPKCDRWNC